MLDAVDDMAAAVSLTALVVATLALLVSLAAFRRRGQPPPAFDDVEGGSMEPADAAQAERTEALSGMVTGLREQADAADSTLRHAVQHVGLVRFNAFDDSGGNQSFALALLDANADGIVLSSLHTRAASRLYVKAILSGVSDASLSEEEIAALRDAGLMI